MFNTWYNSAKYFFDIEINFFNFWKKWWQLFFSLVLKYSRDVHGLFPNVAKISTPFDLFFAFFVPFHKIFSSLSIYSQFKNKIKWNSMASSQSSHSNNCELNYFFESSFSFFKRRIIFWITFRKNISKWWIQKSFSQNR